ncbi:hypothetical protein GCM10010129_80020 [Streptomyces fumigatiscleroticus]|nr:hypothetical protein GCM10010129_80020 [Streptomyces fumigatiscleroticus]
MTSYALSCSSELMQNYVQAEVLAPDARFEALQTQDGTSLLFSLGTDKVMYLTKEVPGTSSGWERSDLSSAQLRADFPGQSGVGCKDFASAQAVSGAPAAIHLAMVLADEQNDHLYLSLANSDTDTSWSAAPSWTAYPFDDPAHQPGQVKIVGVLLSEASDAEYIVVDILRDPAGTEPLVFRYYIDPAKTGGYAWHPHDIAIDLEAGRYSSCLGRRAGQYVDGLYTIGQVAGAPQFQYQPLYNVFDPGIPPSPSLYSLPVGAVPEAIAACRNPDNSSDLYITAGGTLYYLSSHHQQDGSTALPLLHDPRFGGVRRLYAESVAGTVTVWGLNANNEVFYATCALAQLTSGPLAWSVPLPILTGVEQIAPYLDRANSVNTFFAHTGQNQLVKAVKSPDTGLWSFWDVTLEPTGTGVPAQSFDSYTTRIQVTDTTTGQPTANVPVTLTAANVTAVHINYLYYVLGPTPVQVTTDALGVVTVVEPVQTIMGTRLAAAVGGVQTDINPMDHAFTKAAALTTPAMLAAATITYQDGTTKKLVPADTDPAVLQAVATGNSQLAQAYANLPATSPAPAPAAGTTAAAVPRTPTAPVATSLADVSTLLVDTGDLFSWLAVEVTEGTGFLVRLVQDGATQLWNLVVTVGGQAYQCVLNSVEAVVSAAQWLYSALKATAEDVVKYLEYVFDWAAITRTQRVLVNLTQVYLDYQVGQIQVYKGEFDQLIANLEKAVNNWAGVGDWTGLGADGSATPDGLTTSIPVPQQSAPGSLLAHHLQYNASALTTLQPAPQLEPDPNPVNVLLAAVEREGQTIGDTVARLQALAADFGTTPLVTTLQRLVAILSDLVLESARNVVDASFDVLYDIASAAITVLYTPAHVPVVSDILSAYGVDQISYLDLAGWVSAVPVTATYTAVEGRAPFPDNAETDFLIGVSDYDTLLNAFQQPPVSAESVSGKPAGRESVTGESASPSAVSVSPDTALVIHTIGHSVSGTCSLYGGVILQGLEAQFPTGDNEYSAITAVVGILGGVSGGMANILADTFAPNDPIQNPYVSKLSSGVTVIRLLYKAMFCGPLQKWLRTSSTFGRLHVTNARGMGAVLDAYVVVPRLGCSCYHFYELTNEPNDVARTRAIVDEVSSITNDIARVSYAVAVNPPDPATKEAAIASLMGANFCTGWLQHVEAWLR